MSSLAATSNSPVFFVWTEHAFNQTWTEPEPEPVMLVCYMNLWSFVQLEPVMLLLLHFWNLSVKFENMSLCFISVYFENMLSFYWLIYVLSTDYIYMLIYPSRQQIWGHAVLFSFKINHTDQQTRQHIGWIYKLFSCCQK